jgi:hypothetical protein
VGGAGKDEKFIVYKKVDWDRCHPIVTAHPIGGEFSGGYAGHSATG